MRSKTPFKSGHASRHEQVVAWQLTNDELALKAQREALQLIGLSPRPNRAKSTCKRMKEGRVKN